MSAGGELYSYGEGYGPVKDGRWQANVTSVPDRPLFLTRLIIAHLSTVPLL